MQYFKVRGVRTAINSPSPHSPLFCIFITILILITQSHLCVCTHSCTYLHLAPSQQFPLLPACLYTHLAQLRAGVGQPRPCPAAGWAAGGNKAAQLSPVWHCICPCSIEQCGGGPSAAPHPQGGGVSCPGAELPKGGECPLLLCWMKGSEGKTWSSLCESS